MTLSLSFFFVVDNLEGDKKMRVIVSSCLLGIDCRYCGDGYPQEEILKLIKDHQLIPVCPEQLGGYLLHENRLNW